MKTIRNAVVVALVWSPAHAGPVLFTTAGRTSTMPSLGNNGTQGSPAGASLVWSLDISGSVHTLVPESEEVQFVLDLQSMDDPIHGPFELASPFLRDGDRIAVDFRPDAPSDFSGFAALATNGAIDDLRFAWRWRDDPCPFPCLGQGGSIGEFDLQGYLLEFVHLRIHEMEIEPVDGPHPDEFVFTFSVTYDFYGTPVPEPEALAHLIIAVGTITSLIGGSLLGRSSHAN